MRRLRWIPGGVHEENIERALLDYWYGVDLGSSDVVDALEARTDR